MNNHFIVCKYEGVQAEKVRNRSVVFIVDHLSQLPDIKEECLKNQIHIHCITFKTSKLLSDINFKEEWKEFPILIESPALGRVSNFLKMASVIRKLNIRFYLSTDNSNCYKDIRILSSLGFHCALIINGATADWDELTELMIYSVLTRVKHQAIDPFRYVENYYHPQNRTDYGAVYFNDPTRYLHLTPEGKLSLTPDKSQECKEHSIDFENIDDIEYQSVYTDYLYDWQKFFLEPTTCACCKGWRICLGKFADSIRTNPGCQDFFGEFLDVVELEVQNNENKETKDMVWQP